MKWFSVLLTFFAIILSLFSFPVLASIEPPDGDITITSIQAVRNTVEDGDMAIVFRYNIPYDTYPTTPASETIMFNLYDTDGTTLITSATPYPYFDYGYWGVGSFYTDNESNPGWGEAYKIQICGSPAYYDVMPIYFRTMGTSDYSSVEGQEDNQLVMASYILGLCQSIEAANPDITLHGATDAGVVLTALGELYFRGAVPGLQSIAPTLFFTQFFVPEAEELEYTANMTTEYGGRLEGTDIEEGLEEIGGDLGVSGEFFAAMLCFALSVGAIAGTAWKGWGVEPGLILASIILSIGALLLGETVLVLRVIMGFISGIIVMFMVFRPRG